MQEIEAKKTQASEQALQDAERLKVYLNSIPYGEYREVVNKILESCMITSTTFGNWRAGRCRIPLLYKSKINEIANCSVF